MIWLYFTTLTEAVSALRGLSRDEQNILYWCSIVLRKMELYS